MTKGSSFAMAMFALLLALLLLVPTAAPVTLAQSSGATVNFTVNPTLFAAGQPASAFLCASLNGLTRQTMNHGDTFTYSFASSIGALTSVSNPVTVNSPTLAATDFSVVANPATHQVVVTYINTAAKTFGYGDSICAQVNFTASAIPASGDVSLASRFTPSVNGASPFVTVSIVNFATGPAGAPGPTGPQGPGGVRGLQLFSATGTFTAPAGVTAVAIEAWGAGGGGGVTSPNNCLAGAGGGAGAYVRTVVQVTPGTLYNVVIGQGGGPAASGSVNAGDGGDTTFGGALLDAGGGMGAQSNGNPGAGGQVMMSGVPVPAFPGAPNAMAVFGSDGTCGGGGQSYVNTLPFALSPGFGGSGIDPFLPAPPTAGAAGYLILQW